MICRKAYGNLLSTVTKSHDRPVRPDVKRDTCHELKQGPVGRRSFERTAIALRISGHDAAEVHSPEEHRHAETNPTCNIHKSRCTSH